MQLVQKEGENETEELYTWLKDLADSIGPSTLPPNFSSHHLEDMQNQTQNTSNIKLNDRCYIAYKTLWTIRDKAGCWQDITC